MGLLTSVQAAEGEAVAVGLGRVLEEGSIYRANKGIEWPGVAQVRINQVWISRTPFAAEPILNGRIVESISGSLSEGADTPPPRVLEPPDLWGFAGVDNSRGKALVLKPGDPWLERLRDSPFLRPYVSGEDLGARPPGQFTRWVIDCGDASLDEVRSKDETTYEFLVDVVRPTRGSDELKSYRGLAERWWQFWNTRVEQFKRARTAATCIVLPKVALFVLPSRAASRICFTNQVVVIEEQRGDELAICRSSAFVDWMTTHATSFGVGGGIRPSITKGLFTFVTPPPSADLQSLSEEWDSAADGWCSIRGIGQTRMQHDLNDPSSEVDYLRSLVGQIDHSLIAAYGWSDIDLELDFHERDEALRFGPSPRARREILLRLSALNDASAS